MTDSITIYFFDKSSLMYDANKDLFTFQGKFANEFLNHCIKYDVLDTDARFFELNEIKLRFELDLGINLINTTLKNESKFACWNCSDSGIIRDYEETPCGICENSRIIEKYFYS